VLPFRPMGFGLINTVAVAAKYLQQLSFERILIFGACRQMRVQLCRTLNICLRCLWSVGMKSVTPYKVDEHQHIFLLAYFVTRRL